MGNPPLNKIGLLSVLSCFMAKHVMNLIGRFFVGLSTRLADEKKSLSPVELKENTLMEEHTFAVKRINSSTALIVLFVSSSSNT